MLFIVIASLNVLLAGVVLLHLAVRGVDTWLPIGQYILDTFIDPLSEAFALYIHSAMRCTLESIQTMFAVAVGDDL